MKCPHCEYELPDNSRYCSRCGRPTEIRASAGALDRVILCRSCRSANAKGMTTCGSCGAALDPSAVITYAPPPTVRLSQWKSPLQPAPGLNLALKIASILLVIAGIATLVSVALTLARLSDVAALEDALAESGLGSDFLGAVEGFVMCCVTIMVVAAAFSFVTAFLLRSSKRSFPLCLVGAGVAMLGAGPFYVSSILAIIALILIAISGDEFG